ncbi:MAG: RluA family pseudouridine synthase [Clostridiales bacterium]|nr:RluA family pseudouridine synthase [Clostridiales bacterium]
MREIEIKQNEAGQRFDKFLAKYMNLAPKSFFYKMLRKKNITLNKKKADGSEILELGDKVILFLSDETIEKFSELKIKKIQSNLNVLYEDSNVLLINKPVNMLSQKAKEDDISMVEHVISYMLETKQMKEEELRSFKPSVCNRLDRNTTGILVAGKTLIGLQSLSKAFKERSIKKYYLCVVLGELKKQEFIEGFLYKDEKTNQVTITREQINDSVPIMTEYTPLSSNGSLTLLKVDLITGKAHQIRAHLGSIGHPILGDNKYGDSLTNREYKAKYKVYNQLLHSYQLVMPDFDGELKNLSRQSFEAPLPFNFENLLIKEKLYKKEVNIHGHLEFERA